jgi:hypothetical protein
VISGSERFNAQSVHKIRARLLRSITCSKLKKCVRRARLRMRALKKIPLADDAP